jgi:hypothetical protein
LALLGDQGHGLPIERYEGFAAKPGTLVGDQAIREVTARLQARQPSINRWAIDSDIAGVESGSVSNA